MDKTKVLRRKHGNYGWLPDSGNFVVSNNGIESASTYLVVLLALFFTGAGKLSVDHPFARQGQRTLLIPVGDELPQRP